MGRSWADHGQTMGDRFMRKNLENFSFFRYRFSRKFMKNLWFLKGNEQSGQLFLQTTLVLKFAQSGRRYQTKRIAPWISTTETRMKSAKIFTCKLASFAGCYTFCRLFDIHHFTMFEDVWWNFRTFRTHFTIHLKICGEFPDVYKKLPTRLTFFWNLQVKLFADISHIICGDCCKSWRIAVGEGTLYRAWGSSCTPHITERLLRKILRTHL